mgnify:CR=1 FL=1
MNHPKFSNLQNLKKRQNYNILKNYMCSNNLDIVESKKLWKMSGCTKNLLVTTLLCFFFFVCQYDYHVGLVSELFFKRKTHFRLTWWRIMIIDCLLKETPTAYNPYAVTKGASLTHEIFPAQCLIPWSGFLLVSILMVHSNYD